MDVFHVNEWIAAGRQGRMWVPCYHGVVSSDRPRAREGYEMTVSAREFKHQLEWLGRHRRFVDLPGALRWLERPDGGKPPVLVSFDDGYRNNLTLAAPILRKMGVPAIFFLSTGYVGTHRLLWPLELDARLEQSAGMRIEYPGGNAGGEAIPQNAAARAQMAARLRGMLKSARNQERLDYLEAFREATTLDQDRVDHELHDFLSWDEARELAGMGFDIGSHTHEHPILSRLEEAELVLELSQSKQILERQLSRAITTIAYPNGGKLDYSATVIAKVKECGYSAAFAVDERWQKPLGSKDAEQRFALSRTIVPGHLAEARFSFVASGAKNLLLGD